jgi:D-aminopeptidase
MIIVATDAPLDARRLRRLAKRASYGLVRTGGISGHGSGDYVIAFSTAAKVRYPHRSSKATQSTEILRDDRLSPLFLAAVEATEEAIYHSLLAAEDMSGYLGNIKALPKEEVKSILREHNLYEIRDAISNDL